MKATNVIKYVISPFAKQLLTTKLSANFLLWLMNRQMLGVNQQRVLLTIIRFHDAEEQRIVSRFWSLIQVYDKQNIDKVYYNTYIIFEGTIILKAG